MKFTEEFFAAYRGLIFQVRAEGISVSDRRVVKLLKLFAASAFLDGRAQPDSGDFFVLKHIWNNEDQAAILESIVTRSEEHTSELQSQSNLVCRLLLEKKKKLN